MDGPLCSGSLIGTLAPPNRVAAKASSIPVKPRDFFLRRIADTTPKMIAATMTAWINMRIRYMG